MIDKNIIKIEDLLMQGDVFSFCLFIMISSITPGPNNLMLLQGGINKGFFGCSQHILGIMVGCASMTYLSYLGVGQLIILSSYLLMVIKFLGSGYLLWLTWCVWNSGIVTSTQKNKDSNTKSSWKLPLNFWQATVFQFINPKAWMMSAAAPSIAIFMNENIWTQNIVFAVYHFFIGLICISFWAAGGATLKKVLYKKRLMFIIHKLIVLGLLYCVVTIWLGSG